jgi:hypothetical protein
VVARRWFALSNCFESVVVIKSVQASVTGGRIGSKETGKAGANGSDGLDSKCCSSSLDAINNYGFPNAEPVLDVVDVVAGNLCLKVVKGQVDEDIAVSAESLVTLNVEMMEFDSQFVSLCYLLGLSIHSVNCHIM